MAKTKYSRSTWNKNTLSANLNTPRTGSKGCSLCADRSIPANLNAHVTDSQTCADVHLQLAMLRYDNAMCATGQEQYQELCCMVESPGGFKTALAFMVGALATGFILKKIVSSKSRRIEQEQEDVEECNDDLPGTVSFNSRSSRSSHGNSHDSRTSEVEMPSSCYHKMEDPKTKFKSNRPHGSRLRGSSRPVSRSKSRARDIMPQPQSKDRNERHQSRNRPASRDRPRDIRDSRPVSRTRDRSRPRDIRDNRPVPRTRDRSRPRDIMPEHHSRDRSQSRGRNQRSQSRSHPRDIVIQHHSKDSRPITSQNRTVSSRSPRDRSRSRGRNQSRDRSRGSGGRSQSRTKSRSQLHEVETGSGSDDAIMLPTQLV